MLVIRTENLSKKFKDVTALKNLNLAVEKGDVFGLLGPNGAGKTTTLKILMGYLNPTSGSSYILGEKVSSNNTSYKKRIGYLPDVPAFYPWMKAEEYLAFCSELAGLSSRDSENHIKKLLELSELENVNTKIGGFSRGMKQRLGLAQALINNPELIFLDEPTSALDPIGRREVLQMIKNFSGSITVFLSTHILTDVERVCDKVGILNEGQLIAQKSIEELKKEYFESALELNLSGQKIEQFVQTLADLEWVEDITSQAGMVRMVVTDLGLAQNKLPVLIGEYNLQLENFTTAETTLEDIFVKLVSK